MKKYFLIIVLPLSFLFFDIQPIEAQVSPIRRARVAAGKPTVNVARARTRRRVRRRTRRRINRRTVNTLPAGVRTLRYKRVNYYPINGFYYVKQNTAYVSVLPPVGFRVATIPWAYTTHTVGGNQYFYANGLYYARTKNEYEITEPPVGVEITKLPEGYKTVSIDNKELYTFADTLYKKSDNGYELIGFLDEDQ